MAQWQADLSARLRAGFEALLTPKLANLLVLRAALEGTETEKPTLTGAVRGRRRAFFTEQCANVVDELHRLDRIHSANQEEAPGSASP